MSCRPSTSALGFSLVEFLCVLAIAAILGAIGGPPLGRMLRAQEAQAQGHALAAAMRFARSEAIARGARVTLCRRAEGAGRETCATSGGDWAAGWLVFVDGGDTGSIDAGDTVLRVFPPPASQLEVVPSAGGGAFGSLSWGPTGTLLDRNGSGARLQVRSAKAREAGAARWVCVTATGRARVAGATDRCAGDDGNG